MDKIYYCDKLSQMWQIIANASFLKRTFDILLAGCIGIILSIPFILIAIAVRWTSIGPIFYWSDRVGRNNRIFKMPKFRSMRVGAPTVATHLLGNPGAHLTPIGSFLRRSSLAACRT